MKFRLTFVFLILGIALAVLGGKGLVTSVLPAKDIYDPELDWTKLKSGQRVCVNIDYLWDCYEVTTDDYGKEVTREYALPDLRFEPEVYVAHFIGVTARSDEFSQFDKLVEDSLDWDYGEYELLGERGYIPYDGYLKKMDKEDLAFFQSYLKNVGYSESEINDMIVPFLLVRNQTPLTNILMFAGGIVLTALGALFGFLFFIKGRKN